MTHVIVEVKKLLHKQVVDELDIFVVGHVHFVFLSMIMYRMIRGVLQAQRMLIYQCLTRQGAGAANPLFLLDNRHVLEQPESYQAVLLGEYLHHSHHKAIQLFPEFAELPYVLSF